MAMTSEERKVAAKARREAQKVFGMVILDDLKLHLIGKGILCHGPIFKDGQEGLAARLAAGIVNVTHFPEHDDFVATEDDAPEEKAKYVITFKDEASHSHFVTTEMEYVGPRGAQLDVVLHNVWWFNATHERAEAAKEATRLAGLAAKRKAKAKR